MPEFIRVRDEASGHELSILTSASRVGYEVLDESATYRNGEPLPPKHKRLSGKKETGQKATDKKES